MDCSTLVFPCFSLYPGVLYTPEFLKNETNFLKPVAILSVFKDELYDDEVCFLRANYIFVEKHRVEGNMKNEAHKCA